MNERRSRLKQLVLFGALLLVFTTAARGQTAASTRVYDCAEVMPSYRNDTPRQWMSYVFKELSPVLYRNRQREGEEIASLYLRLLIDPHGRVRDVQITRPRLSTRCEREVREKLLTMTGWTPARRQGQPVCCWIPLAVSCLKWQ
ncbi:energy transducer TonB [Hymenobacter arizonensis]|uniref:TonB protein C-terminal n=1 Tax=Hymenobacter arizonensis TaxID=1227077 RepID=A0A1I6BP87_HYMAR|nr:hypothetical protein [Hymenobacter arizonensis]SFQ82723.1 hypothetical protein SAMN04515668_4872 [Hymenobacter arizonensis]